MRFDPEIVPSVFEFVLYNAIFYDVNAITNAVNEYVENTTAGKLMRKSGLVMYFRVDIERMNFVESQQAIAKAMRDVANLCVDHYYSEEM